ISTPTRPGSPPRRCRRPLQGRASGAPWLPSTKRPTRSARSPSRPSPRPSSERSSSCPRAVANDPRAPRRDAGARAGRSHDGKHHPKGGFDKVLWVTCFAQRPAHGIGELGLLISVEMMLLAKRPHAQQEPLQVLELLRKILFLQRLSRDRNQDLDLPRDFGRK